jgi:acyl-coenzyme A thioesterase PaaI-like protein
VAESWQTRVWRWAFNWFPAYRASGGRIEHIAADWREVRIRLSLNWRTRNYVGTIFGGSMYSAIDPMYMVMLIKLLGAGYEVWDKAATIRFRRPGRATLRATFRVSEAELESIRSDVARDGKTEREYTVELKDPAGEVCASCVKLLSIRRRPAEAGGGDDRQEAQAAVHRPAEGRGRQDHRDVGRVGQPERPGPARALRAAGASLRRQQGSWRGMRWHDAAR